MKEAASQQRNDEQVTARGPYQGVWQIVQFNWPFYAISSAACALGAISVRRLSGRWKGLAMAGVAPGAFWTIASLLVSHYVYDRSSLSRWHWIKEFFPTPPRRWANIHAGLDETSLALRALFPESESRVLDIYNPRTMSEPSIERARRIMPAPVSAEPTDYHALPLHDKSVDAVFLLFAAHEIRDDRERLRFGQELHRVLDDSGKLLIVEHLRDAANFVSFGPGFFHFLPRRAWLHLARESGFVIASESRITPFVRVFVMEKINAQESP